MHIQRERHTHTHMEIHKHTHKQTYTNTYKERERDTYMDKVSEQDSECERLDSPDCLSCLVGCRISAAALLTFQPA